MSDISFENVRHFVCYGYSATSQSLLDWLKVDLRGKCSTISLIPAWNVMYIVIFDSILVQTTQKSQTRTVTNQNRIEYNNIHFMYIVIFDSILICECSGLWLLRMSRYLQLLYTYECIVHSACRTNYWECGVESTSIKRLQSRLIRLTTPHILSNLAPQSATSYDYRATY